MNTSKILIPLFLLLFLPKILRGQEREEFSAYGSNMVVKLNIFAPLNVFEPTLAVAFEHRLKDRHYLEHEVGYLYAKAARLPQKIKGLRYSLGYHYVYDANDFFEKYAGIHFHYRQLFGELEEFLWRKNFAYQEKVRYQNTYHSYGFTIVGGNKRYWSGKASRWFTEFQAGIGLSWRPFKLENYPNDAENPDLPAWIFNSRNFRNDGSTLTNGENPIYLNGILAVKVGYRIK